MFEPSEDQRDLGNYRQCEPSASLPSVTLDARGFVVHNSWFASLCGIYITF